MAALILNFLSKKRNCNFIMMIKTSKFHRISIIYSTQERQHTRGVPGGSEDKASACSAVDLGSIPGSGRSPGGGHGNPLQCSCLENPMDKAAWQPAVEAVAHTDGSRGSGSGCWGWGSWPLYQPSDHWGATYPFW